MRVRGGSCYGQSRSNHPDAWVTSDPIKYLVSNDEGAIGYNHEADRKIERSENVRIPLVFTADKEEVDLEERLSPEGSTNDRNV